MVRWLGQVLVSLCAVLSMMSHAATLDSRQGVMHPDFRSLQVYATAGGELADAVVVLGDDDSTITVEFDELSSDRRYMRYSLIHCDASWQPSSLVAGEYLEGFNEGVVEDYDFSRATTVQYVHYRITLPDSQVRFTVSGNYLLRVYDESDPDATLLQARFMVTEQSVSMASAEVTSRTDIDYNDAHQQLSFTLDAGKIQVHDAFNDFKVVVTQNDRPDTERVLTHPLRMQGDRMVYEHQPELIFPAGNEYRRFETVTTRMPGMNVGEVFFRSPYYHAVVGPDAPRTGTSYTYDRTQHGGYVVREYNSDDDSDTEADYVVTHFVLETEPVHGTVYIDGDLTDRRPEGRAVMEYNAGSGCYETALLLKQGSYNYQYLVEGQRGAPSRTAAVEGDFYNTVNLYRIAVYHRLPGQRYDRLVGYFNLTSL